MFHKHNRLIWSSAISIVLLLALMVLIARFSDGRAAASTAQQPATTAETGERVAATTTQSPYSDALQAIINKEATQSAAPRSPKPAEVFLSPTADRRPTATPRLGILEISMSSFQEYHIAFIDNQWVGEENDGFINVAAGSQRYDNNQGFVGIISGPKGTTFGDPGVTSSTYLTPIKAGPVRITAVNGTLFTLEAANGIVFVFDRVTGQFVDTPPSSYPTATPGITPTPSPIINP